MVSYGNTNILTFDASEFEYNLGNMKILKFGRKRRIRERSKKCNLPMEIQQFWNLDEIMDSINAAKIEYNLGNMKNCENQLSTRKKGTPKKLMKPVDFEQKSMMMLQGKKMHFQKAYETCRF